MEGYLTWSRGFLRIFFSFFSFFFLFVASPGAVNFEILTGASVSKSHANEQPRVGVDVTFSGVMRNCEKESESAVRVLGGLVGFEVEVREPH